MKTKLLLLLAVCIGMTSSAWAELGTTTIGGKTYYQIGDANDLAEKLKTVLQGGYDYSLIDKAYHHVCEEYDVSTTAKRYLEEYRRVLKKI